MGSNPARMLMPFWLRSYGPSPSGDAQSLGYMVLDSLAGLPWLDPCLVSNNDVPADMKILAASGWSKLKIYKNFELVWPEVMCLAHENSYFFFSECAIDSFLSTLLG